MKSLMGLFDSQKKATSILLILSSFFACGRSTDKEPVLATVGDREITKQEFVERAELSLQPRLQKDKDKNIRLLDFLIGEKLLALEAERLSLDTSRILSELVGFAQELAVARELYIEEVRKKVQIEPAQIEQTAEKMAQSRTVAFLLFPKKDMAESYRQRLANGESFGNILQEIYGTGADTLGNRMTITLGDGEAALDDAIYELNIGEISKAVPTSRGFAVIMLENIERKIIQSETDHANLLHKAEKVARARLETARSGEFVSSFMHNKAVHLNENVFPEFAKVILRQIDFEDGNKDAPQKLNILPTHEIDLIQQGLADRHNEILVRFKGGDWTIGEVINRWRLCNLPLDLSSPEKCRRSIVRNLSTMVRDKFLADEGYNRGYNKRTSVQREVGMWRDYYLYVFLKKLQKDSSPVETLDWSKYLKELRQKYVVKVDTTFVRTVDLMDISLLAVRAGQYGSFVVPPWPNFE